MPNIKQVYNIVNSIATQALGTDAITTTDASFVDIGKTVLSSDDNKSAWYNTLIDRIGRTVLAIREYNGVNASLKREPFEYGAILQKLSFEMLEAKENTTWLDQNAPHSDPFAKTPTSVKQAFFNTWSVWEYDNTIPDVQLMSAFKSETEMLAFIDGLFMAAYNSLELAYENMSNIARGSFMASIINANGTNAINLLANYNAETGDTLTAGEALYNANFLKYATRMIKLTSDRLTRMSKIFNNEKWTRHTPKDLQVVNVLADFSSAVTTYLESDTYHNEMVKLPNYEEIPYWQGSGQDYSFESTSKLDLTIPEISDGNFTMSGILATIYDRDAVGVTIDKRRTRSVYNPKDEYTNYFIKAEMGYYRDMSENGVVFYIADVG